MRKVFGIKENVTYKDREGAHFVPIKDNLVCVVQTAKGYFHPIQTYYVGELLEQISIPVEEDHKLVWLEYDEVAGKMHVEMQNWTLEQCWKKR